MARFASAEFTIRAINKTQKSFAQINQGVNQMDQRFSKLGRGIGRFGGLMATAFVGKQITDTITKFEKLEASLRTVTGSADKAATAFGFIQEFAATTPFQLEEVTDSFIKLKALGLTPSEKALTSYGNTATAMGKSLNQMIEAVADATTGEFERLKEFGIKSKSQGDQVTFTFQGVSTTVGKNATEIEAYLQSIGDVQFAGAMEEQAGTLNVALSNMGDSFSKLVKTIGDAGLTDILIVIADKLKWLAEKIAEGVKLFALGFRGIIGEIVKFGNYVIEIFTGIGDAFNAFFETIGGYFSAFGKDLADFINDPLSGVSFDNTSKALETGLLESMDTAFNAAIQRAKEFNADVDAEIGKSTEAFIEANEKKKGSLADLFEEQKVGAAVQEETNRQQKEFNDLQREAERIIESTLTPMEKYNKEVELLEKLLKKALITQEQFNRAVDEANEKLEKDSEETTDSIKKDFEELGKTVEDDLVEALDVTSDKFLDFGSIGKKVLSEINQMLVKTALDSFGVTGKGGLIGDLFGGLGDFFGGGKGGGGASGLFSGISSLFGGFFADGGKLKPGQFGVVGERGPELAFAGSSPLNIMPNGMGGSPVTVNMNIQTPDAQSFRQSQTQIAADMARTIERARRNL